MVEGGPSFVFYVHKWFEWEEKSFVLGVTSIPVRWARYLDLLFNLRRDEDSAQSCNNGEVGASRRDYALVSGEMWLQALKWHSDSRSAIKHTGSFSSGEVDVGYVYPLQPRLILLLEATSSGIKIVKRIMLLSCSKGLAKSLMLILNLCVYGTFVGE